MMLGFNHRAIDRFERAWRRNHGIADGDPSTLVAEPGRATDST